MATNFIQPGEVVTVVTPVGGVTSGDPVLIVDLFGVAVSTEVAAAPLELALTGVWTLPKEAPLVINEGDALFWDDAAGELDKTNTNVLVGVAVNGGALSAATTVTIRLNGATIP